MTCGYSASVTFSLTVGLQPTISFWHNYFDNGTKSGISEKRCTFNFWVTQSANKTSVADL